VHSLITNLKKIKIYVLRQRKQKAGISQLSLLMLGGSVPNHGAEPSPFDPQKLSIPPNFAPRVSTRAPAATYDAATACGGRDTKERFGTSTVAYGGGITAHNVSRGGQTHDDHSNKRCSEPSTKRTGALRPLGKISTGYSSVEDGRPREVGFPDFFQLPACPPSPTSLQPTPPFLLHPPRIPFPTQSAHPHQPFATLRPFSQFFLLLYQHE
jgi:hypothetical protein